MKTIIKLALESLAGITGNLIAGWIQQDIWGNTFTPIRIVGTIVGAILMFGFLFFLEAAPKKQNKSALSEAITSPKSYQLRNLIISMFDDGSFMNFCYDNFPSVYERFSQGQDRMQKAQLLIDYCQRYGKTEELLGMLQEINPYQYYKTIRK